MPWGDAFVRRVLTRGVSAILMSERLSPLRANTLTHMTAGHLGVKHKHSTPKPQRTVVTHFKRAVCELA